MDYDVLKEELKQISAIAGSVPEPFRLRCFEVLLEHLLAPTRQGQGAGSGQDNPPPPPPPKDNGTPNALPTPAQVRVFMQKTGVTIDQLGAVVTIEDGELHFLREPTPGKVAQGQIQWALLLALKSGILGNSFSVDPEAVRSACQDKGFYDKNNFARHFKTPANAKLFKKALEPQGEAQALTSEGMDALATLVRSLATGT